MALAYFFRIAGGVMCFMLWSAVAVAQATNLTAYYSFDNFTTEDDTGQTNNGAIVQNLESYVCGPSGVGFEVTPETGTVTFPGQVSGEFDTEDFTISFYFKPAPEQGTMDLFSKREACTDENAFAIRYSAATRLLNVFLSENSALNSTINYQLPATDCWYYIAVARQGRDLRLFVDGIEVEEVKAVQRVNISNSDQLKLGGSPCVGITDRAFIGVIDEIRVHSVALDEEELQALQLPIDRILNNPNQRVFLGGSVDIMLPITCADTARWTPADGVSDPGSFEPTITPSSIGSTTYTVELQNGGCIAQDTLRITVIDPDDLQCDAVFLPSAFTPNGSGPLENERYGISNPEAIQQLLTFEIYDRWGSVVFFTESAFDTWDGTYKSELLNPGVYLYRVTYVCDGEDQIKAGSLTLLR